MNSVVGNNPYNFTEEQYQAFQKVLDFCNTPFTKMYLITGVAGTGKTYLITKIVAELKNNNILVTAPTHKAVKVLQSDINYQKIMFATVHSALGLKEKIDGYGNVTFEPDSDSQSSKISNADYMIIDEVSMMHDQLFDILVDYVEHNNLKIIMVGDPVQIPPIGKKDAKPFQTSIQKKYKIYVSELNTIIRQKDGHPIIEKSYEVRQRINEVQSFISRNNIISPVGSVFFINRENLEEKLKEYFDTSEFKQDMNFARMIAWTNAAVNSYNNHIRRIIYKQDKLPKIVIGEILIMDAPVFKFDRIILNTNDEVEVVGFKICKEEIKGIDKYKSIQYYDTLVKYETAFFGNMHYKIKIVHENSEHEFNEICELVKQVALQERQGSEQARRFWVMYYRLKEHFAAVKYAYAITAHKSQGSTYIHTFIDEYDINKNSDIVERNRIKYTAITRAKKNVYIIG